MRDLLIIGAGPAGLAAAAIAGSKGVSTAVVDEYYRPGGRLLGQLHEEANGEWWNGLLETEKLVEKTQAQAVPIHCGVSVYDLQFDAGVWHAYTNKGVWKSKNVLLASGAMETPLPVRGWTLPGVMSIGAAQVMTNVQRVKPGARGAVIGLNALSFAITRELQLAGIEIVGMYLPPPHALHARDGMPTDVFQDLLRFSNLAPSKLLRTGASLMQGRAFQKAALSLYPPKGLKVWGIPMHLRQSVFEITGEKHVEAIRVGKIGPNGEMDKVLTKDIPVDFVCIAGGLAPLVELAAIAGSDFDLYEALGGHVPFHNEDMTTNIPGFYVAGNLTGIESAKVARSQGHVAGLSVAATLNGNVGDELAEAQRKVAAERKKAAIQFRPGIAEARARMYS